jgi:hypothetical protein
LSTCFHEWMHRLQFIQKENINLHSNRSRLFAHFCIP